MQASDFHARMERMVTECHGEEVNFQLIGKNSELIVPCARGCLHSVQVFTAVGLRIGQRALVNCRAYHVLKDDTTLHVAMRLGHADIARVLLAAHSDPDARNVNGITP